MIGFAVDYIWSWIDDPADNVEEEVSKSLDKLAAEGGNAIQVELIHLLERRVELWRKAVDRAIKAKA